jgi:hypothetical protein
MVRLRVRAAFFAAAERFAALRFRVAAAFFAARLRAAFVMVNLPLRLAALALAFFAALFTYGEAFFRSTRRLRRTTLFFLGIVSFLFFALFTTVFFLATVFRFFTTVFFAEAFGLARSVLFRVTTFFFAGALTLAFALVAFLALRRFGLPGLTTVTSVGLRR